MIRAGELFWAQTEAGRRPVVVVSREEMNRGHWVVAVFVTSTRFELRSQLPHCVPFQAGEFGLSRDCVAQAETISFLPIADLDMGMGAIGVLDDARMRSLVKAIGHVLAADCEPG